MVSDCLVDVKNDHEENQGISLATAPLCPFGCSITQAFDFPHGPTAFGNSLLWLDSLRV